MDTPSVSSKKVVSSSENNPTSAKTKHASRRRVLISVTVVLGILLLAASFFALGFSAGIHKARFSYRFGENYERNFVNSKEHGMRDRMLREMDGKPFRSGHGVAGEILSVTDRTIALRGPDGQENSIQVTDGTVYNKGKDRVDLEALTVGDRIVVLGTPSEDGVVIANLIRVFDPGMRPGGGFEKNER
ncbi:MAG: hypothetical protein ACEQSB_01835 [Undibacterium sp.]